MRWATLFLALCLAFPATARTKYALLVQTVAPHQVRDFRRLLIERFGFEPRLIVTLARDKPAKEGLGKDMICAPPRPEYVKFYLRWMVRSLKPGDLLVLLACAHTRAPFLIDAVISYAELDKIFALAPEEATIVVILEGCQSGAAVKFLDHADVVYTSCSEKEFCFGGFIHLFIDALGRNPKAFQKADLNGDGKVTLGEAFEYASARENIEPIYKSFPKKFWPFNYAPHPQRKGKPFDMRLYLGD